MLRLGTRCLGSHWHVARCMRLAAACAHSECQHSLLWLAVRGHTPADPNAYAAGSVHPPRNTVATRTGGAPWRRAGAICTEPTVANKRSAAQRSSSKGNRVLTLVQLLSNPTRQLAATKLRPSLWLHRRRSACVSSPRTATTPTTAVPSRSSRRNHSCGVACCMLRVAFCALCCMLRVAPFMAEPACCVLHVACCMLHVACCVLRALLQLRSQAVRTV